MRGQRSWREIRTEDWNWGDGWLLLTSPGMHHFISLKGLVNTLPHWIKITFSFKSKLESVPVAQVCPWLCPLYSGAYYFSLRLHECYEIDNLGLASKHKGHSFKLISVFAEREIFHKQGGPLYCILILSYTCISREQLICNEYRQVHQLTI